MTRAKPLSVEEAKARLLESADAVDWKTAATPLVQSAMTILLTSLIKRAGRKWATGPARAAAKATAPAKSSPTSSAARPASHEKAAPTPGPTAAATASTVVREHAVGMCMDACEAVLQSLRRSRQAKESQNGVHHHESSTHR